MQCKFKDPNRAGECQISNDKLTEQQSISAAQNRFIRKIKNKMQKVIWRHANFWRCMNSCDKGAINLVTKTSFKDQKLITHSTPIPVKYLRTELTTKILLRQRNPYLGVSKITYLQMKCWISIQQRIFQLQVPMTYLLHEERYCT